MVLTVVGCLHMATSQLFFLLVVKETVRVTVPRERLNITAIIRKRLLAFTIVSRNLHKILGVDITLVAVRTILL